jgi:hypothetical protein
MNRYKLHSLVRRSTLLLICCSALSAAPVYDLRNDWSDTNNPNGAWAYRQGGTALPHNDVSVCCEAGSGVGTAWAPGSVAGIFLPLWAKTTASNATSGSVATTIKETGSSLGEASRH